MAAPGADPAEQALADGQVPHRLEGVFVAQQLIIVQARRVIDLRDDGLLHVLQALDAVIQGGSIPTILTEGFISLRNMRAAHEGAGGAHAGHEGIDLAAVCRKISGPVVS